jgi:hypothetical protein
MDGRGIMIAKQLMEQIKDLQATVKIDIMSVNPAVRPGVEGRIRSATQTLPSIIEEYKKVVLESAVPILVSGKHSEDFAKVAELKFNTVSIDYNAVNERIIDDIKSRSQRNVFSNQEYLLMLNQLNLIGGEIGARMMSKPDNNQDVIGKTIEDAVNALLDNYYGDELRSTYAAQLASKLALKAEFSGLKLPVVLFNSTGKVSAPFGKPVATLEINEIPSEDEMLETFSKIKNKLKTKK